MMVHPGDPLDQTALLQTQRNLYNIALFNEVVAAVQNPAGDAPRKNVLLQLTEAKRWDVTYGFGFEAQTGTPHGHDLRGIVHPAEAQPVQPAHAGREDGGEPAGVAGCVADQSARDGRTR